MTDTNDGEASNGGPAGGESPRDPAEVAGELADELESLRSELRRERRGPFGLPAPPRPRELLQFADEYAIPFAIAVLEANLRALELLQATIRAVETGEAAGEEARAARDRAHEVSRTSLDRLDGVLADLETAASGRDLPSNDEARSVIERARQLRAELASAMAETEHGAPDGELDSNDRSAGEVTERNGSGDGERPTGEVPVDVESELRSIKADLDDFDEDGGDGDGENGDDDEASVSGTGEDRDGVGRHGDGDDGTGKKDG
ncbi:MAG: hypothetical protein V5A37_03155 [Halobacteriales archaeon]